MEYVLICTVGNRDVEMTDWDRLPSELREPGAGARARGVYLQQHVDELIAFIRLPIVEKALRYVRSEAQRTGEAQLRALRLVVSEQDDTVPERYRSGDTIEFGKLIQAYLARHHEWKEFIPKSHIHCSIVRDNPASFDAMQRFYRKELPRAKQRSAADAAFYLCLSGGTPAMTAMLLVVGAEAFGEQCQPLGSSALLVHRVQS